MIVPTPQRVDGWWGCCRRRQVRWGGRGVCGMFAALILGAIHLFRTGGGFRAVVRMLRESLIGTLTGTASVFLLIVGVAVLTRAMALSQVPNFIATEIAELGLGRVELLFILIVAYLILGMFMDAMSMLVLTVPIAVPMVTALGVDPVWFGVFVVVMCEIGLITPPVGMNLFVVQGVRKGGGDFNDVIRGATPFVIIMIVFAALLVAVPQIALFLPDMAAGR